MDTFVNTEASRLRERVAQLEAELKEQRSLLGSPGKNGTPAEAYALHVLDGVRDGVAVLDRNWRYLYINPVGERFARKPREQVIGQVIWELFPELVGTNIWKNAHRTLQEGVHTCFEEYYPTLELLAEVNLHPTPDGLAIFVRDVTEEKRIVDARLAAIVDSSDDAIISKDLNGIITSWNRGAERLFGYSAAEAIGKSIALIALPERAEEMPRILDRIRRGDRVDHFQTERRRKDGQAVPISLSVSPIRGPSGEIVGASKIARDVTEHHRSERRLRESEERVRRQFAELEAVYRTAPVGLGFLDQDLRFVRINERFSAVTGRLVEARVGQTIWEAMPQLADQLAPLCRRALETGESIEGVEITGNVAADPPSERIFRTSCHRVNDPDGVPMGIAVVMEDATEPRTMEKQLRRNEEHLRLVIDGMPGLVSYLDKDLRYQFANRLYSEWMGLSPEQIAGRTISEVFPPDECAVILRHAKRALRGEDVVFERFGQFADKPRHTHVTYMPDRAPGGEVRGFVALVLDVSEQYEANRELRASEEQYRMLANALPHLVWIADSAGNTLFLNDYWSQYTGATAGEGIAAWYRAVPADDQLAIRNAWFEASKNKSSFEVEHHLQRHSDGQQRWHLARVRPILDAAGEVVRWVGTAVDIHDRKLTELELNRARRDLTDILESITESFIAVDREWRFVYVNARVAHMVGIKREDLIGRNMWEVSPESVHTPFWENYHRVMNERVPVHFEMPFPPNRWFDVYAHPTEAGMSAYVVDKTEQKRNEDALRQRAKLESLGLIAGGVAHDFNNLLVGMMGAASLVQDALEPGSQEYELTRVITDSAERAAHLTSQMLAYAGKSTGERKPVDLNLVIRDTLKLTSSRLPRLVKVVTTLAPTLPLLAADPGEIQQVVLNLLTNAAEAFPAETPGTISIVTHEHQAQEPFTVGIDRLAPGDYLFFSVRDTGMGMPPETRDKIFDPFFTTKFTGRGLGLAAVQGIVRGTRGGIEVESALGAGTTFRIYFGLQGSSGTNLQVSPPPAKPAQQNGTVLVIDDEPVVRSTCQAALERYGFRVVTADNGAHGIEEFRKRQGEFAAVIVDLSMPDQSGIEVIQALEPDIWKSTVIISSGHSEEEMQSLLSKVPAARFIQKPYRAQALLRMLASEA